MVPELGPCNVTEDLQTQLNPYAWNEVSNMLFLSQPIGVGFSYAETVCTSSHIKTLENTNCLQEAGSLNDFTGEQRYRQQKSSQSMLSMNILT